MSVTERRRLSRRDMILCVSYGLLAVGALVATQWQLIRFFGQPDNGGLRGFIDGGFANPAAAFLSVDVLVVAVAAIVFMVVEARRVGVRLVWLYVAAALLIAISVAFPLFLLARQLKLASRPVT